MRSEKEMFDLIINTARKDERIRAVYMNGSRTNPNVDRDIFMDYDIVYSVKSTKDFYEDEHWIDRFGERLYMQMPEKMDKLLGKDVNLTEVYGWLIQFKDGNRLDLHVEALELSKKFILEDKLCKILLDKDDFLPTIPESTDEDYHVKRFGQVEFFCACNEFYWCLNNVAKGLWREEITYVLDMINYYVRPQLMKLLSWKVGIKTDFSCSVGKSGKYINKYLEENDWKRYLDTFSNADVESIWSSTYIMCNQFDDIAKNIAKQMNFEYNELEAENSINYLKHVHNLDKYALEIY